MTRNTEILDDDGNVLTPPEPGSDAANAIYLLEYARKRGFRVGPTLKIGDVVMQVRDLRQETQMSQSQREEAPDLEPGSDMALLLMPEG